MLTRNLFEYLERSAAKSPDAIAFADGETSLSYSRLLTVAEGLGAAIAECGATVNRPVAVLSERSAMCVAGFMGAICAGEYYVPLDDRMPLARLEGILERLSPAALLFTERDRKTAEALNVSCPRLSIGEERGGAAAAMLRARRESVLDADPAYVIFTSGSTGEPKGIVVSHRAVIDFTAWMTEFCGLNERDVFGNQAPFHFDLSVKDLYQTLSLGARCEILPRADFLFPANLMRRIAERGVTALLWATSAFHLAANSGAVEKYPPRSVRLIAVGGEALQAKQLNIWRAALPEAEFINLYGPTEVTVDCTGYHIDRPYSDGEAIPIGRACSNMEVCILREDMTPATAGEVGEICVRGTGLANGYYKDWERTRAAFIQDPRNTDYPSLLYRTGDLGILGEDGLIRFVTRADGQVKHMGYRIELGEIETALSALPGVAAAVCLYDKAAEKIICCYTGEATLDGLARALKERLPKYMLPSVFHHLDAMPVNANGKTDRAALKESYGHASDS